MIRVERVEDTNSVSLIADDSEGRTTSITIYGDTASKVASFLQAEITAGKLRLLDK